MIFMNEKREQIKTENPGIKITDISKKGGEMWRDLKDKSVTTFTAMFWDKRIIIYAIYFRNGTKRRTKRRNAMLKK